jgi:CheY-like chemotaxis protein
MRVLVADAHSLFRDGIASLLEAAGFEVVAQVGSGCAAVREAVRLNPDLALIDITLSEMSGLEALRQIKQLSPEIPIVMLTISDVDRDLFDAVKSGALGYLTKDLTASEFLKMLKRVLRGEVAIARRTGARPIEGLCSPGCQRYNSAKSTDLCPATGCGRILTASSGETAQEEDNEGEPFYQRRAGPGQHGAPWPRPEAGY